MKRVLGGLIAGFILMAFGLLLLFVKDVYGTTASTSYRLCTKVKPGSPSLHNILPRKGVPFTDENGEHLWLDLVRPTSVCSIVSSFSEGRALREAIPSRSVCYKVKFSRGKKKPLSQILGTEALTLGKKRELCVDSLPAAKPSAQQAVTECEPCAPCLCGNGDSSDPGEQCDDGNHAAGDGCSPFCTLEFCGSGIIDPGEQCDFPSESACPGNCTFECRCGTQFDSFPNMTVVATIAIPSANQTSTVVLSGDAVVSVDLGSVEDTDGNGLEEVATRIVQLDAFGTSLPFGSIRISKRDPSRAPFGESTGVIEEAANTVPGVLDVPPFVAPGTATGALDAFFELELSLSSGSVVVHNEAAVRLLATLSSEPPLEGEAYLSAEEVALFDEARTLTPARLVSLQVILNAPLCGNGDVDFGEACDPRAPASFLCTDEGGHINVCAADCTCGML